MSTLVLVLAAGMAVGSGPETDFHRCRSVRQA
jgi:hypothetical protein